jgi:hypothetical protein
LTAARPYINEEPTPVAHTSISGLPTMTEVGFHVVVKDATGTSAWSQTVTIFVH